MEKEICKLHTKCRACESEKLTKYLDLGRLPLANNLEDSQEKALKADRYPLQIMLCEECGLSQLSVVIDPETLFSYYTYRSGVNGGYIKHCRQMAKTLKERYDLNEDSFVVDIAGNDGTLLNEFLEEVGCDVLNVDPAENLAEICRDRGIPTYNAFWSKETAKAIQGQVDLITATNVFAHVDDIKGFLEAAKIALKPKGILIIECPYVLDHIQKMEFTQTYFEHLSYMSTIPIEKVCSKVGLHIRNIEHMDIHGGTIRVHISPTPYPAVPDNIIKYTLQERRLHIEDYKYWGEKVDTRIYWTREKMIDLKSSNAKIAAFSASAKGNTLLNSAELDYNVIDYIVDETPEKIGKYSPGTGIPIVGFDHFVRDFPDYLVILSWNFAEEIVEKCKKAGYGGKFIIPVPNIEII